MRTPAESLQWIRRSLVRGYKYADTVEAWKALVRQLVKATAKGKR